MNLIYCIFCELIDVYKRTPATACWRNPSIKMTIIGEISNIITGGSILLSGAKIGSVMRVKNLIKGFVKDINQEKITRIITASEYKPKNP